MRSAAIRVRIENHISPAANREVNIEQIAADYAAAKQRLKNRSAIDRPA